MSGNDASNRVATNSGAGGVSIGAATDPMVVNVSLGNISTILPMVTLDIPMPAGAAIPVSSAPPNVSGWDREPRE
jgi:hypothetical protein